jgi:hypothetical protein
MRGEIPVLKVHPDVDLPFVLRACREPDVIEVAMGQHDRGDIVPIATDRPEGRVEHSPGRGESGVDDRQAPAVFDEIAVGVRMLETVDAGGDVTE